MQIAFLVAMFAVMYFVMLRPQAKRQRQHQAMLAALGTDDVVVTRGGMIGRIAQVSGDVLDLEVQDKVRIRVPRGFVQARWTDAAQPAA